MNNPVTYKIIFTVGKFGNTILDCGKEVEAIIAILGHTIFLNGLVEGFDPPKTLGVYSALMRVQYAEPIIDGSLKVNRITIGDFLLLNKYAL